MGRPTERKLHVRTAFAVLGTVCAVLTAACLFIYPGVTLVGLARDPGVHRDGQPTGFPQWFEKTARHYRSWAEGYLTSRRAQSTAVGDIASTEWPLFGTVFFLASAEELIEQGKVAHDEEMSAALDAAARVVVDPATAHWVRAKWGEDYATRGNVFYRMLVLHGLTSFERATHDQRYHALQQEQAKLLAAELSAATYHLADDYPGECYPTDVLWAVVAIERALGEEAAPLAKELMSVLDGKLKTAQGVPAFSVNSETAKIYQGSRGSGTSGILCFAGELDADMAQRWYDAYVAHHWQNGLVSGFREVPFGRRDVMDVDSGPVLFGLGSVASLFGIGAARANGRFDHASLLTQQVLAVSWPTPFGLLLPGLMGWLAADGWCFGELALSFAMTRPTYVMSSQNHDGSVPALMWIMIIFYLGTGALILVREATYWRSR